MEQKTPSVAASETVSLDSLPRDALVCIFRLGNHIRWPKDQRFVGRLILRSEQLLDALHRIAFFAQQAVNASRQGDVGRAVIAAVAGALQRPELRELRLPVAQDMLRDI